MDHDMGSMPDHNFIIPSSLLSGSHKQDSSASSVTPSTLMSMNSTPHLAHKRSSVLLNPNHHKSAQSSPVILPSSSMPADSMKFDFKTLNHAENYNNIIHQGAHSTIIATPILVLLPILAPIHHPIRPRCLPQCLETPHRLLQTRFQYRRNICPLLVRAS